MDIVFLSNSYVKNNTMSVSTGVSPKFPDISNVN